nr:MAG TPA: hypothetical protein [Caudoviricetes sp.]
MDLHSQLLQDYDNCAGDGKPARIPSSAYGIGKLLDTSILCISSFLFIILFHLSCTLTKHCGI